MTGSLACLAVVPIYLRTDEDLDVLLRCLVSLRQTAPQADVLVVDDFSPESRLVDLIEFAADELEIELHRRNVNGGFSRAVNVGLRRALDEGRDAVLVNADIEFRRPQWLEPMLARTDTTGAPAAVVGARLLYPNGLIQHAGVYYSTLHRFWAHRFNYGPADLPEALVPCRCPVTGALQLIRHECLATVGIYDESFRMGHEDVDYCLRVFASGRECIYEPAACATHAESLFRRRKGDGQDDWERESAQTLMEKYATSDLSGFRPTYE
ncbi:MAG TPA: glycosyltransferase family 2 protein [Solirubrobacteraceae bacterium]|nr:glycosyltransferase family 2 protein [Solirubrobacteraceae bacterium]